jgi:hypothetical protein
MSGMRALRVLASIVIVAGLVGCGGGDDGDDGGADASAATAEAAATAPGTEAPPAPDDSGARPSGDLDCAALQPAIETVGLGWQVYPQLATQDSVDNWSMPLLDVDLFAQSLETLRALEPLGPDVATALDQMTAANDIARRGVGGDAAALDDAKALFGENPLDALTWVIPVSQAYEASGCPAVG